MIDHCDAYSSTVRHCYYLDCMVGSGGGQQLHVDCTEDKLASVLERALVMLYPTAFNTNTNISLVIYDATVFNRAGTNADFFYIRTFGHQNEQTFECLLRGCSPIHISYLFILRPLVYYKSS